MEDFDMTTTTLATNSTNVETTTWTLDGSHTQAQFKVRHMMIANVTGEFKNITGSFQYNAADPTLSVVEATIDASSIETREANRDAHLRSADFFDVENYPNLTFRSKKFEKAGEGEYKVTGDLTIKDVTREVVLNVEGPTGELKDPWGNSRIGVTATTHINRKDFGLTWNVALEAGGILVGDDIKIAIEAEFTKQA
jgi:polyisoprenoid-binding protein YceI